MAVGDDRKDTGRRASKRGVYYSYTVNGRQVFAKWPEPKKRFYTEGQRETAMMMREATKAMQSMVASQQEFMARRTKNSQFLPRDMLLAALWGKGATFITPNGRTFIPMARSIKISEILDNLGFERGAMLYRAKNRWELIPPGQPGDVLTWPGQGFRPAWAGGGGGGGIASALVQRITNQEGSTLDEISAEWETAVFQDGEVWSIEFPDRLYFPPDVSRIRLTAGIIFPSKTSTASYQIRFVDPSGNTITPGSTPVVENSDSTGTSAKALQCVSAWLPRPSYDYARVFVDADSLTDRRPLATSWAQLEWQA